ncbi:unnamed protein product [Plutella xylostella]|uniref:(diamondback moth) hypothetical protein n=1 Tax=Plutella xylostella TaxID=51655 RepID=A0A8S4FT88_PLUXY|nr:unnamed protein product [Plutella xylostella]
MTPKSVGSDLVVFTLIINHILSGISGAATTSKTDLECEFPPKLEEDLTHIRRKRLTTETGLVCLEDYPYTVSVRLHNKHWCGGAIVHKQWILSAAQCFDYVTKQEVTVRLGSVFRDFGGRILSVVEIVRHPNYRLDQYYPENNLALIKLNLPMEPSPRLQPVRLAPGDADRVPDYGELVVTGYGAVVSHCCICLQLCDSVKSDFTSHLT